MRTIRFLFGAAVAAASLVVPAAHASDPAPTGQPCVWNAVSFDSATWTGEIHGGPVAAPGYTVSLRCSIHDFNDTHDGAAAVAVSSSPTPDVAAVPPTPVTFTSDWPALCTEATVGATTWYWSGGGWTTDATSTCGGLDEVVGTVLDAVHAVTSLVPDPYGDLVDAALDEALCLVWVTLHGVGICDGVGPILVALDQTVCPVFAAAAPAVNGLGHPEIVEIDPATGDTSVLGELFWDCPPYAG